jgi:hypothetical protein
MATKKSVAAMNSSEITEADLLYISDRAKRVRELVTKSGEVWLEIASEFAAARERLSKLAFERFINEAGFTNSVALRLVTIGNTTLRKESSVGPFSHSD